MDTVAIITPSYNNREGLVQLVNSLEQLTWPKEKIKLYICDDGSTDKTVSYFKDYKTSIELEILTHPKRLGPAHARNMGLEKAKADLILFLDSDLEAAPDLIEWHVECYKQPDVIAVRGENKTLGLRKKSKWFRYLDSDLRGPRQVFVKTGKNEITHREVNTNNFSIRGSLLSKDLRFDENIIHYGGEDMIFAFELMRQKTGRILFEPRAMTFHQHREFSATLIKLEEYGKKTIPYLLETYPETYSNLIVSRFFEPNGITEKIFWSRVVVNSLGYFISRATWRILPDVLAFRVIQYIMAWHVLKGYRESMKSA